MIDNWSDYDTKMSLHIGGQNHFQAVTVSEEATQNQLSY